MRKTWTARRRFSIRFASLGRFPCEIIPPFDFSHCKKPRKTGLLFFSIFHAFPVKIPRLSLAFSAVLHRRFRAPRDARHTVRTGSAPLRPAVLHCNVVQRAPFGAKPAAYAGLRCPKLFRLHKAFVKHIVDNPAFQPPDRPGLGIFKHFSRFYLFRQLLYRRAGAF